MNRQLHRNDIRKDTANWVEDDRVKGRLDPRVMAYGAMAYKRYREIAKKKTGRGLGDQGGSQANLLSQPRGEDVAG